MAPVLTFTAAAAASEVGALLAFKRVLTVPLPPAAAAFFATWDATATSPCDFAGVTCDPVGRVITVVSIQSQGIAAMSVPFADI